MGEITHVVSTTCTNSANPGFDHYVSKELGLRAGVEKILLHGIGCSGGLAAIRAAANLALGSSFRKKPARVLVLACEVSSVFARSELDSIDKEQTTRIGICLFSDGASACILTNGIGEEHDSPKPIYELLGWKHEILEDTENDLGFDVDPLGSYLILYYFIIFMYGKLNLSRLESHPDSSCTSHDRRCSVPSLSRALEINHRAAYEWQVSSGQRLRLGSPPWRLNHYYRR